MEQTTYWRIILGAFVILVCIMAVRCAWAVPYSSPPASLSKIWWKAEGQYLAVLWQQEDGTYYCLAGDWLRTIEYFNTLPGFQDNEALPDYMMRARSQIANRDLAPEEMVLCQALAVANRPAWVVKQYRTYETRPVKRITNGVVDTQDTIGRIAYGEPCGNEVESGTSTMWREVTIQYQEGPVVGAAVCEEANP